MVNVENEVLDVVRFDRSMRAMMSGGKEAGEWVTYSRFNMSKIKASRVLMPKWLSFVNPKMYLQNLQIDGVI